MKKYNPRQCVELFHLLFLNQLGRKVNKSLYALKGGCNMRFYFKSVRYSEDMDIDVKTILKDTLTKNVNNILSSVSFKSILRAQGIEIEDSSNSKNTETTQRWKIKLKLKDFSLAIHTKIEFSRREFDVDARYEAIDPEIIGQYSVAPFMTTHYAINTMFSQKICALAGRSETQSRDIFDLYLLISSGNKFVIDNEAKALLSMANDKASSINYEDFKGQVVAYLPEEYRENYADELVWQSIIETVTKTLNGYI